MKPAYRTCRSLTQSFTGDHLVSVTYKSSRYAITACENYFANDRRLLMAGWCSVSAICKVDTVCRSAAALHCSIRMPPRNENLSIYSSAVFDAPGSEKISISASPITSLAMLLKTPIHFLLGVSCLFGITQAGRWQIDTVSCDTAREWRPRNLNTNETITTDRSLRREASVHQKRHVECDGHDASVVRRRQQRTNEPNLSADPRPTCADVWQCHCREACDQQ